MKFQPLVLVTSGALMLAMVACGDSSGSGGSGGTGSGTTTATSSTSKASSSGNGMTSTGTGSVDCTGIVDNTTACGMCLESSCCKELADCQADGDCLDCETGNQTDPSICGANAAVMTLDTCLTTNCDVCVPKSACNPVTNEGCDTAGGEACDLGSGGVFGCFGPPNDVALCGDCSNGMSGPYCKAGSHCTDPDGTTGGKCTAYCCTDGDCGAMGGTCDKTNMPDGVGVCIPMGAMSGTTDAVCDSTLPQPSGGTCYTGATM